jgi:hypothetical protein
MPRPFHAHKSVREKSPATNSCDFLDRSPAFATGTGERQESIGPPMRAPAGRDYISVALAFCPYTSAPCHPVARAGCCVYLPDEARAFHVARVARIQRSSHLAQCRLPVVAGSKAPIRKHELHDEQTKKGTECVVVRPLLTRVADDVALVMTPGSDSAS